MGSYAIEQRTDIHFHSVDMRDTHILNQLLKLFLYVIKRMNMGLYPALMS